jgi:hypothetical protein
MLARGRLDAVLGVRQNFEAALAEVPLPPELQATQRPMGEVSLQLWLSPRWAGAPLEARARAALVAMRRQPGNFRLADWTHAPSCGAGQQLSASRP